MSVITLNPASAREKFYQLLKEVNENHSEIQIISSTNENNAVLI
ncbi:MAG: type II toxin-antitoxin system Phd/YefM family antitoxin, partial [Alkalibacterium sp.]